MTQLNNTTMIYEAPILDIVSVEDVIITSTTNEDESELPMM